jgi:hypothetical protein
VARCGHRRGHSAGLGGPASGSLASTAGRGRQETRRETALLALCWSPPTRCGTGNRGGTPRRSSGMHLVLCPFAICLPLGLRCAARNCPINSRLRRRGGLRTRRQCLVRCGSRGARAPPVLACAASGTTATPAKARGSPVCRRHFSSADPTFGRDRLHVEQVVFCRDRFIAVHVTFREWPTAEGVERRDARPRKGNASRARCLVIAAIFRWTCCPRSDRLVLRRISSQLAGPGKWEILREN